MSEQYLPEKTRQAILIEREKGGILGGPEVSKKIPVRYILQGEQLPTISEHVEELEAGVLLGEIIVNRITPLVLSNKELTDSLVHPFISAESLNYITRNIKAQGLRQQFPVINRTDMLLTPDGLKANEINPDVPEAYSITKAGDKIQKLLSVNNTQPVFMYFESSHSINIKSNGHKSVVIPYWSDGYTSPVDAVMMAEDLRERGYNVEARPAEGLSEDDSQKYDAVIRVITFSTPMGQNKTHLPLFLSDRWAEKPQYPAPWTDVAALKHWFALVGKTLKDDQLAKTFRISDEEKERIAKVMLPTYSTLFSDEEEIRTLVDDKPEAWVAKETMSSHGEGFNDGAYKDVLSLALSGRYTLQEKANCVRSNGLLVLHPNGLIKKEHNWLIDMDTMGSINGLLNCTISRVCPEHPMNIAGTNGGGSWNPYYQ